MTGGSSLSLTRWARAATITVAAGLTLIAGSGVANARQGSVTPKSHGASTKASDEAPVPNGEGGGVIFDTGGSALATPFIYLTFSGGTKVLTYCIDLEHNLAVGKPYDEATWGEANPGSDLPKILWVLTHSQPNVSDAAVLQAAGTSSAEHAAEVVYAGTQAAIWHWSDGFTLGAYNPDYQRGSLTFSQSEYAAVTAVYRYLTGESNTGAEEPPPALSITPDTLSGYAGQAIGPFTVATTAQNVTLSATNGAQLLGADRSTPVTSAANGETFWVKLDAPGSADISASGSGVVPTGRIFVSDADANGAQKLILAGTKPIEVAAKVSVTATVAPTTATPTPSVSTQPALPSPSVSPSPTPLPNTGASPMPKVLLGLVLLLGGTGLTLLARKRRRA